MSRHRVRQGSWYERITWDQAGWVAAYIGWVIATVMFVKVVFF